MARDFQLPPSVVSPSDVAHLQRNLETFHDVQRQAALRSKSGVRTEASPPSALLQKVAANNDYDLDDAHQREDLLNEIVRISKEAPMVTISFAVDPSSAIMAKLVTWLRTNIHPQVLVRIGLQPNIAAGCIVRTPSKEYDFSLRSKFTEQRPLLVQRLRQVTQAPQAAPLKAPVQEAAA